MKNGQSATEVEGSQGEGCLRRRKEVQEEVVQGKGNYRPLEYSTNSFFFLGPRQARQRLRLRSGHLRQGHEGSAQLQGHHPLHRLRSNEDPWLPRPNCHQGNFHQIFLCPNFLLSEPLRCRQDQVPDPARFPDGLHPGHQPRGVTSPFSAFF